MDQKLSTLYETDYYTWAREMSRALKERRSEDIDWDNIAEEVADLGDEKRNKLIGYLSQSFAHLIKYDSLRDRYPDNANRWRKDAEFFLQEAMETLQENPGLKGEFSKVLEKSWKTARREVFRSFDEFTRENDLDKAGISRHCPWSPEEILSGSFLPSEPLDDSDLRLPGMER